MKKVLGKKSSIAVFVLPGVLLFTAVIFIPVFCSLIYSLQNWDGLNDMTFVGFGNYKKLIIGNEQNYLLSVKNTMLIALMTVCIQIPIALLIAIVLSDKVKGEGFFRTAYFVPSVISSAAIGQLFLKIYNPDYGLINTILRNIGLSSVARAWLGNETTALIALIIPIIWQYIGQHMLLLYAGIKAIDPEVQEAAIIDGASRWQRALKITIPLIAPMLEVCLTLGVVGSIKIFDMSMILTSNGEPFGSTIVQAGLMQKQIFTYSQYGLGSATAMSIVVQCLILTLLIQWAFRRFKL